ncbi:hypothetical protein HDV05_000089 [Chytridiales sp. JEL 0842]|nr:hypothetical protein HDV05_000089 [Chytridiales sp. JEL 0842]
MDDDGGNDQRRDSIRSCQEAQPSTTATMSENDNNNTYATSSSSSGSDSAPFTPLIYDSLSKGFRTIRCREEGLNTIGSMFLESISTNEMLSSRSFPSGLLWTDLKGHITHVNERFLLIVDISAEELERASPIARSRDDMIIQRMHPMDRQWVTDEWERAVKELRGVKMEYRYIPRDADNSKYSKTVAEADTPTMDQADEDGVTWVSLESCVDYFPKDTPRGFIVAVTDITAEKLRQHTAIKQLRKEESDARIRAEDAEKRRIESENMRKKQQEFVDMICHEIRNPLNGIQSNNELLADAVMDMRDMLKLMTKKVRRMRQENEEMRQQIGNSSTSRTSTSRVNVLPSNDEDEDEDFLSDDQLESVFDDAEKVLDEAKETIDSISLCLKHQKHIADDVLNMSKLSLNLLKISTAVPFQPPVLLQDLIKAYKAEFKVKEITYDFDIDETSFINHDLFSTWVRGDPARLTQVLINLLSNSIKFTVKSTKKHIGVKFAVVGRKDIEGKKMAVLEFEVRDSGIGMSEEEKRNMFKRFSQASTRTYCEYGGSGMGLFISKKLIELMGGDIFVESIKGNGCAFRFTITCDPVPAEEVPNIGHGKEAAPHIPLQTPVPGSPESLSPRQDLAISTADMHCFSDVPQMSSSPRRSRTFSGYSNSSTFSNKSSSPDNLYGSGAVSPSPLERNDESIMEDSMQRKSRSRKSSTADYAKRSFDSTSEGQCNDAKIVLIADDNEINRVVLSRHLQKLGFKSEAVVNGKEAVQHFMADPSRYGLILMDLEMPVLNGCDAARCIRYFEQTGSCPRLKGLDPQDLEEADLDNCPLTSTHSDEPETTGVTVSLSKTATVEASSSLTAPTEEFLSLSKLELPGLSLDLCDGSGVPIIAVTGNARSEHMETIRQCGMISALLKPYTRQQLKEALDLHFLAAVRHTKREE